MAPQGEQEPEGSRVETARGKEEPEVQRTGSSPGHGKDKKHYSLHYQYRKRRQEEIDY